MKLQPPSQLLPRVRHGYALIMVMLLTAASLTVLSAALSWTANFAQQSSRALQFSTGGAAAEAAVEQVIGAMSRDYFKAGEDEVSDRVSVYRKMAPTGKVWGSYQFSNLSGSKSVMSVDRLQAWDYRDVPGKYEGLKGYTATYKIGSQVRDLAAEGARMVSAAQELSLASIPVCNYQVFYFRDMEICPLTVTTFNGPVHANGNIYVEPQAEVIFQRNVTATARILHQSHPADPVSRKVAKVIYKADADSGVNTLSLPLGTNNSPDVLRTMVEVPPAGESAGSVLGSQRYYNQAQLVILIYSDKVVVTSGAYNGFKTKVTYLQTSGILDISDTVFDKRQNRHAFLAEFDVAKFIANYTSLTWTLGRAPWIVYLADFRMVDSQKFPAVRLVNGQTLPEAGLTIVTPNPIYVQGNYNVMSSYLGTTNTTHSRRAALVGDAITILSPAWDDRDDGRNIKFRVASDVTVNALVIAGIVPTKPGYYSGGVENLFRHLEDWSRATFTFNGSMVALFDSRVATAPWGATGDIYEPPMKRAWTYDYNLQKEERLPHGVPQLRSCIRGQLAVKLSESTSKNL